MGGRWFWQSCYPTGGVGRTTCTDLAAVVIGLLQPCHHTSSTCEVQSSLWGRIQTPRSAQGMQAAVMTHVLAAPLWGPHQHTCLALGIRGAGGGGWGMLCRSQGGSCCRHLWDLCCA